MDEALLAAAEQRARELLPESDTAARASGGLGGGGWGVGGWGWVGVAWCGGVRETITKAYDGWRGEWVCFPQVFLQAFPQAAHWKSRLRLGDSRRRLQF